MQTPPTKFTPAQTVLELQQMNQAQYVLITQLIAEVNSIQAKLKHCEALLSTVSNLDVMPPRSKGVLGLLELIGSKL